MFYRLYNLIRLKNWKTISVNFKGSVRHCLVHDHNSVATDGKRRERNERDEKKEKKKKRTTNRNIRFRSSEWTQSCTITSHRFINSVTLETRFTSPWLGLGNTDNRYHDARIQSILTVWVYPSQSFESIFFLHDIFSTILSFQPPLSFSLYNTPLLTALRRVYRIFIPCGSFRRSIRFSLLIRVIKFRLKNDGLFERPTICLLFAEKGKCFQIDSSNSSSLR